MALWHERDISHSSAERVILPDSCGLLDFMLDEFATVVEGLRVYPERMRANLEADGGLAFSQSVLLALVDAGSSRDDAYRIVQHAAAAAWDRDSDFRGALGSNPEVQHLLSAEDLNALFDACPVPAQPGRRVRQAREAARRGGVSARVGVTGELRARGKVRDLYDAGPGRLLLVASDRISAFDVVLPTPIPDKGRVLTGLSLFWFERTGEPGGQPRRDGRSGRRASSIRIWPAAPWWCAVPTWSRWSASRAATCPARGGRSTGGPARSAASRCRPGCVSRTGCPNRSSRRPPRRPKATTSRSPRWRRRISSGGVWPNA